MNLPGESGPSIGILYPGEMGATVGRLLVAAGFEVLSTVAGRSERTAALGQSAGLTLLASSREVMERADILLSLVSPAAALSVAAEYRGSAGEGPKFYVDLNSTSPETAHAIARTFEQTPIDFVDGAIHGLAARLPANGTIYLSGAAAAEIARVLGRVFKVKVLDEKPGTASTFKMLIAGLNKGLSALFMEVALAARHAGLLDPLLACFDDVYPGVMSVANRTVPTYPQHARRRAEEMRELEETMRGLGLEPCMAGAARAFIEEMAKLHFEQRPGGWSAAQVVEELYGQHCLAQAVVSGKIKNDER